jgi:hypothetical protein
MSTNERMSRVALPGWWLAKALPILRSPSISQSAVAREASVHAGRIKPWTPSAISKFVTNDVGRTVALANGISAALQILPPFFVAPTERAAAEMLAVAKREQAHLDEQQQKFRVVDGVLEREISGTDVDAERRAAVPSVNYVDKGGRGVRARRAGRSRS